MVKTMATTAKTVMANETNAPEAEATLNNGEIVTLLASVVVGAGVLSSWIWWS